MKVRCLLIVASLSFSLAGCPDSDQPGAGADQKVA